MKKKKRELIEILLDNITPDDWPVEAKFAAQDKESPAWGIQQRIKRDGSVCR